MGMNMWKKLRELIFRDVGNENEILMYAVILRLSLLIMLPYYAAALGIALYMGRRGAFIAGAAGVLMCAYLFYNTYKNRTRITAYLFLAGWTALIIAHGIMYGNGSIVFNFMYIQIVLLFALDYLELKWKCLYVTALMALRICAYRYMQNAQPVYYAGESEKLFWQTLHVFMTCFLLVVITVYSTRDFRKMHKKLIRYNEKLRDMAGIDPLTELPNRRNGMAYIAECASGYVRGEVCSMTVAIGDIDFFKHVNDTYGHQCGDQVLKRLSGLFTEFMEGKGRVIRWGGEEFLFVFYGMNGDNAHYALTELKRSIKRLEFIFGDESVHVSMTFGVAEYDLRGGMHETIKEADEKLYVGKENGRDIVIY